MALTALFSSRLFGEKAIVERFLVGEELTITVIPGAAGDHLVNTPMVLPPVRRFNHVDGVAPYNGAIAVTANSVALGASEIALPAVRTLMAECEAAFDVVGARAAIRIDCRADANGVYQMFDLNMKPNMTGAGRPGRDDQDSLSLIAAKALGWSYADLLKRLLSTAWSL